MKIHICRAFVVSGDRERLLSTTQSRYSTPYNRSLFFLVREFVFLVIPIYPQRYWHEYYRPGIGRSGLFLKCIPVCFQPGILTSAEPYRPPCCARRDGARRVVGPDEVREVVRVE